MLTSQQLWGEEAKSRYLFIAAIILLFSMLGARELWTQESRWADIVNHMLDSRDFFHPFLAGKEYYDKPLLSYWLMAGFAWVTGELTTWALRIPSAISGLLVLWSIYRLGSHIGGKSLGLLSGWMLLTTFYFVFWARVSSADMLNLAGTLFAVAWYRDHRDQTHFFSYGVFFFTLAFTALCKGLIAPAIIFLAILPDLIQDKRWKMHLNLPFIITAMLGLMIYMIPFLLSSQMTEAGAHENGLYLVYRENVLRYFQPFDHKSPFYTYFLYLPIYLFPWVFFFIPAVWSVYSRWKGMTDSSRWLMWASLLIFIFLTLSGSRRTYYVLPLLPFAVLLTAQWLIEIKKWNQWVGRLIVSFYLLLILFFSIFLPIYYSKSHLLQFSQEVKAYANQIKPWNEWQIVMLNPIKKVRFYLAPKKPIENVTITQKEPWQEKLQKTIIVTRKRNQISLEQWLGQTHYTMIEEKDSWIEKVFKSNKDDLSVAFVIEK